MGVGRSVFSLEVGFPDHVSQRRCGFVLGSAPFLTTLVSGDAF
ncbi:hypothetical protein BIFGAL_03522 [Bifidobacterium gallicum DSM 20093 = LMG 11596]|uniref:Uncharacterized protein n=1 Tax=Bifidobacterium gallicum DSM 20093 = LMG 11596 TaxID=561180 RepID=D1NUJ7_9BIFI|nr:hypothetical protein BIFGAL_03522 [Bifidobacterium gallicum DSM 20093 = LMG 11596]